MTNGVVVFPRNSAQNVHTHTHSLMHTTRCDRTLCPTKRKATSCSFAQCVRTKVETFIWKTSRFHGSGFPARTRKHTVHITAHFTSSILRQHRASSRVKFCKQTTHPPINGIHHHHHRHPAATMNSSLTSVSNKHTHTHTSQHKRTRGEKKKHYT